MGLTKEEVAAAAKAADEARTQSENAHKAQEEAAKQAKAVREEAQGASDEAKQAAATADAKQREAATLKGKKRAAARKQAQALRKDADQKAADAAAKEQAALDAEAKDTDATIDAMTAAGKAWMLDVVAQAKRREFEAVQATTPLREPFVDDACTMVGAPPAPRKNGGTQSDTKATFSTGARAAILNIHGSNYEKIEGTLVEITVGKKISNLALFESSNIFGGKFEEVGGWESKLVIGGDRRLVMGLRWERNVGLKGEHITGNVTQTEFAGQVQHVPTINGSTNPSIKTETCPELETKATKVVEQHKSKLKELRKTIKQDFKQATEFYSSITSNISTYTDDVGKIRQNVQQKIAKFASLKTEAKKYQMKSDAFIKFIVQGTAKLTAGRFKGSGKAKYHICCDAIAELQGQVKWN